MSKKPRKRKSSTAIRDHIKMINARADYWRKAWEGAEKQLNHALADNLIWKNVATWLGGAALVLIITVALLVSYHR